MQMFLVYNFILFLTKYIVYTASSDQNELVVINKIEGFCTSKYLNKKDLFTFHTREDGFTFSQDKSKVSAILHINTEDFLKVKEKFNFYIGFMDVHGFIYKKLHLPLEKIQKIGHQAFMISFDSVHLDISKTARVFTYAIEKTSFSNPKIVWNASFNFNGFAAIKPFSIVKN